MVGNIEKAFSQGAIEGAVPAALNWPGLSAVAVTVPVVIIGAGPVGVRLAQNISALGIDVVIFNAEQSRPYNRVQLTPLLAEDAQVEDIYLPESYPGPGNVQRYDNVSIIDIDREQKLAIASNGRAWHYESLVFATGSTAFIPQIEGRGLSGVFTFRNLDDVGALVDHARSVQRVAVIGGGLLGLEAARGMQRRNCNVTIVEHNQRLMHKQLDNAAAAILKQNIEALGVEVLTGVRIEKICGTGRVDGVALSNGEELDVGIVLICAGIRPRIDLAVQIGLSRGVGIKVDDQLRTSDPSIFAVGECAEHDGVVYGLVGPGFEQAQIAARVIGQKSAIYKGSTACSKLKVLGADVFSIGEFEYYEGVAGARQYVFEEKESGIYRRLTTFRGRLVAALGVGQWPEASRLQKAVAEQWRIGFLNTRRFENTGIIWKAVEDDVFSIPDEAIVCNCTGTTKGTIVGAIAVGARTIEDIRVMTGANTVCGSCGVQVAQLLDGDAAQVEPVRWWRLMIGLSVAAVAIAMASGLLPPIPVPNVWAREDLLRSLWFENQIKQWSGYTLMGLTAAAALIGLRKRIGLFDKLGDYQIWRIIHLLIGGVSAAVLVWHTGFRLGANLNFYLTVSFLLTLVFGAIAGLITGGEHELRNRKVVSGAKSPRAVPLWIHILAIWPLPILLVFHILSVYSY